LPHAGVVFLVIRVLPAISAMQNKKHFISNNLGGHWHGILKLARNVLHQEATATTTTEHNAG
jgi:hypothetical protein